MNEYLKERLMFHLKRLSKGTKVGDFYRNHFDFIEHEGCFFESKAFLTNESKFVLKRMRSVNSDFPKQKHYLNSMRLMLSDSTEKIGYVEGVIFHKSSDVIIEHAWNEMGGKVIDVSLQKYGEFADIVYYGLKIPSKYVRLVSLRKPGNSIIDGLLDEKYDPDKLI